STAPRLRASTRIWPACWRTSAASACKPTRARHAFGFGPVRAGPVGFAAVGGLVSGLMARTT
ncbi:hypothetical protein, partial [Escherichia coli]|uniref:hypothetical protein n=1 Tax=Escherichia coli TaxID=562 RepID=UPI001954E495